MPKRLKIANLPTPVEKINFNGCSFFIKRDDYTGLEFSGNKIRKLEFLLAEAKKQKCDTVFTCGGIQSNHARATIFACNKLGLKSKVFLRGKDSANSVGNLFLMKISGAEIAFVTKEEYSRIDSIMLEEKSKFEQEGKKVYIIPEGGSNETGVWGYINCVKELIEQQDKNKFTGIFTACGSGGTTAGLLIGAALYGFKGKIYAVNMVKDKDFFFDRICTIIENDFAPLVIFNKKMLFS